MFAVRLYLPCDTVRPREWDNAGSWHVCSDCCYPSRGVGIGSEGGYLHDRPLRGVAYPSPFSRRWQVWLKKSISAAQTSHRRNVLHAASGERFYLSKRCIFSSLLFDGSTHNRLTSMNSSKDGELAPMKAKAVNSSIPPLC